MPDELNSGAGTTSTVPGTAVPEGGSLFDRTFANAFASRGDALFSTGSPQGEQPQVTPPAPPAPPTPPTPPATSTAAAPTAAVEPATEPATESTGEEADAEPDIDSALNAAFGQPPVPAKTEETASPASPPASTATASDEDIDTSKLSEEVKSYLESPAAKRVHANHRALREVQTTLKPEFNGIDLKPEQIIAFVREGRKQTEIEGSFLGQRGQEGVAEWIRYHFSPLDQNGTLPPNAVNVAKDLAGVLFTNPTYMNAIMQNNEALGAIVNQATAVLPDVLVNGYLEKFGGAGTDSAQHQRAQDALDMIGAILGIEVPVIPGTVKGAPPQKVPGGTQTQQTQQQTQEVEQLRRELAQAKGELQKITGTQQQRAAETQTRALFNSLVGTHMDAALRAFDNVVGEPPKDQAGAKHIHSALKSNFTQTVMDRVKADPNASAAIAEIRQYGPRLHSARASVLSSVVQTTVQGIVRGLLQQTGKDLRQAVHGARKPAPTPVPNPAPANLTPVQASGNNGGAMAQPPSSAGASGDSGTTPRNAQESRDRTLDRIFGKYMTEIAGAVRG